MPHSLVREKKQHKARTKSPHEECVSSGCPPPPLKIYDEVVSKAERTLKYSASYIKIISVGFHAAYSRSGLGEKKQQQLCTECARFCRMKSAADSLWWSHWPCWNCIVSPRLHPVISAYSQYLRMDAEHYIPPDCQPGLMPQIASARYRMAELGYNAAHHHHHHQHPFSFSASHSMYRQCICAFWLRCSEGCI